MIRINFCKTGDSVSDWDIDETVKKLKVWAPITWIEGEEVCNFSNFLLLDALRAEIAEGKLSLDDITFSVDDKPLEVNRYGVINPWPNIDRRDKYGSRVLIAAMNLRKKEEEDRYMAKYGVKTFKEVVELKKREKEESSSLAETPKEG